MGDGDVVAMIHHSLHVVKQLSSVHEARIQHVVHFHDSEWNQHRGRTKIALDDCGVNEGFDMLSS